MPRLASEVYATYQDGVLKLAAQQGGVSRPQIMEKLNITRSVADTMIERCKLQVARKEGRTEFFVQEGTPAPAPDPTPAPAPAPAPAPEVVPLAENDKDTLPPEVEEAGVVEPNPLDRLAAVVETDDQVVASIDHEIADARTALREAAGRAGKAMGEWSIQQALVDALRERIQELAQKRLALSS